MTYARDTRSRNSASRLVQGTCTSGMLSSLRHTGLFSCASFFCAGKNAVLFVQTESFLYKSLHEIASKFDARNLREYRFIERVSEVLLCQKRSHR